jgi:hypothetical protein
MANASSPSIASRARAAGNGVWNARKKKMLITITNTRANITTVHHSQIVATPDEWPQTTPTVV